jgi:hypothetical protein
VFTIAPPRVDVVLSRRIRFASSRLETEGRLGVFPAGLTVDSTTLREYLSILLNPLERNNQLVELVDNLSGGNIRKALDFVSMFVGSGHVDTEKMLAIQRRGGNYIVPRHEFLRALIFGDLELYDPSVSPIANLFDISSRDGREHFLLPILLRQIQNYGEARIGEEGFVPAEVLYGALQRSGFLPYQIASAIDRGVMKELIETPRNDAGETATHYRITTVGAYTAGRLMSDFQYVDAMVIDTPILDPGVRAKVGHVWSISDRLERVEIFRQYLDEQWSPLDGQDLPFQWPHQSADLKRDLHRIQQSIQAQRQRERQRNGESENVR